MCRHMLKIKRKKSKLAIWLSLMPVFAATTVSTYAIFVLSTAKIVPVIYLLGGATITALILALVLFLTLKQFRRGELFAKTIAVLLALVITGAASFGLYAFKRGLSVLDSLSMTGDKAVTIQTDRSFNVFISGIDTYGDISEQSRSDVNIVATVNPDTRKVLLTTVPRDSYVPIALGGKDQYDKLTHAGNYGVESSVKTVANLLNTDISAYVRINFTSFIKSIDRLGGVVVQNPTAFDSFGERFEAGDIYLTGERALIFSRERKNLQDGDVDRGKNQQRVIEAAIKKIMSLRSLQEYDALLGMIGNSVQTNLSGDTLRGLINQQLSSSGGWAITNNVLTGKGQTGGLKSYAMPSSQLYMYVLDQNAVTEAAKQVETVLAE